jgi:hypothetical protein
VKVLILLAISAVAARAPVTASAAPSAEVAKRCIHYSYLAYPYKRPGSVRMSRDRQAYFKDCTAKKGTFPSPFRQNRRHHVAGIRHRKISINEVLAPRITWRRFHPPCRRSRRTC